MDLEHIECLRCKEIDSSRCADCLWRTERFLIKKYKSLKVAKEAMETEFKKAKRHSETPR